jgi:hypothetical protein
MTRDANKTLRWVRRGMILVPVAVAEVRVEEVAALKPSKTRTRYDVHRLIACPTCGAKADQRCRTAGGTPTANHADRLISVRCPCGEPVAPSCQYCPPCRDAARKQSYRLRELRNPTRERRVA